MNSVPGELTTVLTVFDGRPTGGKTNGLRPLVKGPSALRRSGHLMITRSRQQMEVRVVEECVLLF